MSLENKTLIKPLIFATGSSIRKEIACAFGIDCEFIKSEVDEELIKLNFQGNDFYELAIQLATEKSLTISDRFKDYYVNRGTNNEFLAFGSFRSGKIGLQDHGSNVKFRNIKIREL